MGGRQGGANEIQGLCSAEASSPKGFRIEEIQDLLETRRRREAELAVGFQSRGKGPVIEAGNRSGPCRVWRGAES